MLRLRCSGERKGHGRTAFRASLQPGDQGFGGVARDMIRISTIFIAICMVLVAASLGLILYSVAGLSGMESAIVALTALTFLILPNPLSLPPPHRPHAPAPTTPPAP